MLPFHFPAGFLHRTPTKVVARILSFKPPDNTTLDRRSVAYQPACILVRKSNAKDILLVRTHNSRKDTCPGLEHIQTLPWFACDVFWIKVTRPKPPLSRSRPILTNEQGELDILHHGNSANHIVQKSTLTSQSRLAPSGYPRAPILSCSNRRLVPVKS